MIRCERTVIAGRVVAELVAALECRPNADPATGGIVLHPHELELDLQVTRVGVAGVGRLEHTTGVGAPSHEQLDGVINLRIL